MYEKPEELEEAVDHITEAVADILRYGTHDVAILLMNQLRHQAMRIDRQLADTKHKWAKEKKG